MGPNGFPSTSSCLRIRPVLGHLNKRGFLAHDVTSICPWVNVFAKPVFTSPVYLSSCLVAPLGSFAQS